MRRLLPILLAFSASFAFAQERSEQQLIGRVGTSFAAKRACSGIFLGGRTLESIQTQEFAPETPLEQLLGPLLEFELDREAGRVTVSGLGASTSAIYRPGLGCVLVGDFSEEQLRAQDEGVPRSTLGLLPDVPWPLGDGQALAEPDADVDAGQLREALDYAFAEPDEGPRRRTRAVLVVHRGRIIAERYGPGFTVESRLEGWSMTKSVTSALIGIRIGQGALRLEADHLLPHWSGEEDPRAGITLDHLLRMSSGLDWSEVYTDLTSDPARMLFAQPDCGDFASRRRLTVEPGARWMYSSGTTNIISGILRASFEQDADYHAFPREQLFDRVGMRSAVLECDPCGNFVGSSYCWATARDWARFGLLYLNEGLVAGERVLPAGWTARCTEPVAASRGAYGRQWWLNQGADEGPIRRRFPNAPKDAYWADGFEGQTVAVIPSLELVVVRLGCTKGGAAFSARRFLEGVVAAVD